MSQSDFGDLESPLSGTAFINTYLEPWRDALHSSHSGSSRPSYAAAGMIWLDTTTTPWVLNIFDGADDIALGTVNATTNLFTPSIIGTIWCGTSGGTANAQTLTPSRAISAYTTGQAFECVISTPNTAAAPTINISAVGAKTVKYYTSGGKVNLPKGALQGIARFVYDGTDLVLLNIRPHNKSADIATASTVNLDNATGDYVHLTGTTTITAITLAEGVQKVCVCDGSFTLTDSSTDSPPGIILPGAANITTAAGDVFTVRGEGSGTVRVTQYTKANGQPVASSTDNFSNKLLHVQDQKASGTNGGTFTSGAWQTRTLNTSLTNEISGASLGSNQITLPAGTYYLQASASAYNCGEHKLKLYNISDTSDVLIGSSERCATAGNQHSINALVSGRFTIASSKTFELRHYCSTTAATNGYGTAASFSVVEVYADVKIWKVA